MNVVCTELFFSPRISAFSLVVQSTHTLLIIDVIVNRMKRAMRETEVYNEKKSVHYDFFHS